jgi:hypothetical protein
MSGEDDNSFDHYQPSLEKSKKGTHGDHGDIVDLIEQNRREMEEFVKSAVPDGDLEGHKDFHQDIMDRVKARDDYWKDIKKQVMQSVIGGGIMFLIAWAALKFFGVHLS